MLPFAGSAANSGEHSPSAWHRDSGSKQLCMMEGLSQGTVSTHLLLQVGVIDVLCMCAGAIHNHNYVAGRGVVREQP